MKYRYLRFGVGMQEKKKVAEEKSKQTITQPGAT